MQTSLDIPRSSAHSLIQEFLDNDYRLPDTPLITGLALIKIAANCIESTDLVRDLRRLRTAEQTVGKNQPRGDSGRQAGSLPGKALAQDDLSLMRHIGNHLPAHCTAVGKVLLSQYSDEEITQLYGDTPLEKMTVRSIGTLPVLLPN